MDDHKIYSSGFTALLKSLRLLFLALVTTITVALAFYLSFGGAFTVESTENVIVLRFGVFQDVYKEGWHWSFPYPIDSKVRVLTKKFSLTLNNFWYRYSSPGFSPDPQSNFSGGPLVPGVDGYLLTGDANIIHTQWGVEYRITDPARFYRAVCGQALCAEGDGSEPVPAVQADRYLETEEIVRCFLENAIVKSTAIEKVDTAVYKGTKAYGDAVKAAVAKEIDALDIGLTVDNLMLKRIAPPLDTEVAFASVASAENELDKLREAARSEEVRIRESSRARATETITQAEAYRKRVVSEVESEKAYFEVILDKCQGNPAVLMTLYSETLTTALSNVKSKYLIRSIPGGYQELRLQLNDANPKQQEMEKAFQESKR